MSRKFNLANYAKYVDIGIGYHDKIRKTAPKKSSFSTFLLFVVLAYVYFKSLVSCSDS